MTLKLRTKLWLCAALIVAPLSFAQAGDSGWYLGGSVGAAAIEVNLDDGNIPGAPVFDEEDFAWKAIFGYNFGITPVFDLGIEGGYVDLGAPTANFGGAAVELDPNGWNVFGVIGFDIGPVGVFGKVGYIAWDVDAVVDGTTVSDDGSDLGYGAGVRFNLGSIEIRGEYELYDIDSAADVNMWSAGLVYHFN
jgi:outer membrane immunogenic protein